MATLDSFKTNLNSVFRIKTTSDEAYELELIEACSLNKKNNSDESNSFSLLFRYLNANLLQQSMYSLEHEKLGTVELFLVPLQPEENYNFMEAVFN